MFLPPRSSAWWRGLSYIRVCDRGMGARTRFTHCVRSEVRTGWPARQGSPGWLPREGTLTRCHCISPLVRPFPNTVSWAPRCSPEVGFGPGLSLPLWALDSHEHTLPERALSVGHSPKAWEGEAKTPRVGEGRAGWSPGPVLPWAPQPCFLGKVHQDQASRCPNVF